MLRVLALTALLLLTAAAPVPPSVARFTVQVASTASRDEAERLVAVLAGRDLAAHWATVDVKGKTMYRVRVGSFATRAEAQEHAASLPADLKLQYWVAPVEPAAKGATKAAPTESPVASPMASPAAIGVIAPLATGADVLAEALDAHGGAAGGFGALDAAGSVVLRYRLRSLDAKTGQPVFTRHVYSRKGKDRLRLEITPIEELGNAASPASVTIADPSGGSVTSAGKTSPLAANAARARIEALGPAGMLRLPLAFPQRGAAAAGIAGATRVAGTKTIGEEPALRIDAVAPPSPYREASLYFSPETKRLVGARFLTDAGELLLTFGDYRRIGPSLIVPFRRSVYRDGALVSAVEIDDLQLE